MAIPRVDEEQLARMIPQAVESLTGPDPARLDEIEQRLLALAPACPRSRIRKVGRSMPWWMAGLWAAAASAAAWWGVGQWHASQPSPEVIDSKQVILPESPHTREARPQTPPPSRKSSSRDTLERHASPFVFRR